MLWDWDGMLERLHHTLYVATREQEGCEASPTAAIIDSLICHRASDIQPERLGGHLARPDCARKKECSSAGRPASAKVR